MHKLDPRIKLTTTILLSIVIIAAKPLTVLVIGLLLLLLAAVNSLRWRFLFQAIKPLLIFFVLIFLAHALFTEGEAFFRFPYLGIAISFFGIGQGILVVGQFCCLLAAAIILTMTTMPSQMIAALKFFIRPLQYLRIPIDDISVMLMLAMRFMPFLLVEKENLSLALQARCHLSAPSGIASGLRAFLRMATMLLIRVFSKVDKLAPAMEARCYARGTRTSAVELRLAGIDYIALVFLSIFIVIFVALNYRFG